MFLQFFYLHLRQTDYRSDEMLMNTSLNYPQIANNGWGKNPYGVDWVCMICVQRDVNVLVTIHKN